MTTYKISTPEQLRKVVPAIKDQSGAPQKTVEGKHYAELVASVWTTCIRQGQPGKMDIHIEIGRDAKMILKRKGRPDYTWALNVRMAREIAKELE